MLTAKLFNKVGGGGGGRQRRKNMLFSQNNWKDTKSAEKVDTLPAVIAYDLSHVNYSVKQAIIKSCLTMM